MQKKRRRIKRLVLIVLILVGAFLIRDSRDTLELTGYFVRSESLPQEFDGFKIVQLSDLHGADFNGELSRLVSGQRPDIIVFTGDFVNNKSELPVVEKLLGELSGLADIYCISGNHDFGEGKNEALCELFDRYGARYLHNEYLRLERNGESILLLGVEDPNSWEGLEPPDELVARARAEYPEDYALLLGHRNYWATEYPSLPVDLILCGHEHGGLIRIPGLGGLIGHEKTLFPEYAAGAYDVGSYKMIVSRGLGNSIPVPRILNRPEIVTVTLKAG